MRSVIFSINLLCVYVCVYSHLCTACVLHIMIITYSVSQKTPAVFGHFFPNSLQFLITFYTHITRSYLRLTDCKFYSIISNFDEVMPY